MTCESRRRRYGSGIPSTSNGNLRYAVLGIMPSQVYEQAETRSAARHDVIANKSRKQHTSSPKLKFLESKTVLWIGAAAVVILFALAYFFLMPVAEVATVQRGTAISAVYGTVRIEPAFVVRVRAQNDGFIRMA